VLSELFIPQVVGRIRSRSPESLVTDGQQGDSKDNPITLSWKVNVTSLDDSGEVVDQGKILHSPVCWARIKAMEAQSVCVLSMIRPSS